MPKGLDIEEKELKEHRKPKDFSYTTSYFLKRKN